MKTIIKGHEIAGRLPTFKPELREKVRTGDKVMTRRVMKPQPEWEEPMLGTDGKWRNRVDGYAEYYGDGSGPFNTSARKCPYGKIGDIRVMPEPIYCVGNYARYPVDLKPVLSATSDELIKWRWKRDTLTSMFMPMEAGRTLVEITGIRAERLQDISAQDCIAEGIPAPVVVQGTYPADFNEWSIKRRDEWFDDAARQDYVAACIRTEDVFKTMRELWDFINAKPKPSGRNPYTGEKERCSVSYPWEDVREVRKRKGLNWYVIGNPWNWALEWRLLK